jgi:hypothetical protein
MRPKPPAPSESADFRRWKSRAAAMLERKRISRGVARERDLRKMYIGGATPEQAAEQMQVLYWNTRPAFERMRKAMGVVENEADD